MTKLWVVALSAVCVLAVVPSAAADTEPTASFRSDAPRIPGEVVVRFDPSYPSAAHAAARAAVDADRVARLGPQGLELVEIDGTSVPDAIAELEQRPDVLYAEPNYVVSALAVPNDPYFQYQWGLDDAGDIDINAPQAWNRTTGSENVLVAVVDTGVAWDHPDLAANVWTNAGEIGSRATNGVDDDGNGFVDDFHGWDWVDDDNDPMDVSGHGTHVAGTVAARGNNGSGVTGVGWNTKVLPLRVLDASGAGGSADVARAFWYAADSGARVVNASFGTPSHSQAVSEAVAQNPDVLFVAAAGNDGTDNEVTPMWPCNLTHPNIVCVTAVARDNSKPGFANVGSSAVDIAAPGATILSTGPNLDTLLSESFESDVLSRWETGGTSDWGPGPGATGTGFTDSPGGAYASGADTRLVTRSAIDTTASNSCALYYELKMDTVRPDVLYVEKSRDGSSWQRVASYAGSTEGRWVEIADELAAVGPRLFLRFRLLSDGSVSRDGVSIDDVVVRCAMSTYGNNYMYSSGTSMAAPHVSGVAGLLFAAVPDATPVAVRSAMLQSAAPVPALAGRIASGGRVDASAAMTLIAGALPDPDEVVPTPTATLPPLPDPTASPEPTVSPEPTITPEPETAEHARSVTARMAWGRRLRGRLAATDGYAGCIDSVQVRILRNGRLLRTVVTGATGSFSTWVPSRSGRYRAVADGFAPSDGHLCLLARSTTVS